MAETHCSDFPCAGQTRVVCATIAFGLGMDIPDVGLIVHWDAAKTLQEYVQQVGRGGRSGCQCLCVTMFSTEHFEQQLQIANRAEDTHRREQETLNVRQVREFAFSLCKKVLACL